MLEIRGEVMSIVFLIEILGRNKETPPHTSWLIVKVIPKALLSVSPEHLVRPLISAVGKAVRILPPQVPPLIHINIRKSIVVGRIFFFSRTKIGLALHSGSSSRGFLLLSTCRSRTPCESSFL